MEDQLLLSVGRTMVELSAQKEDLLQAFKKLQEQCKQLQARIAELEKPKE